MSCVDKFERNDIMIKINGKYNTAICYTDEIETSAYEQLEAVVKKALAD